MEPLELKFIDNMVFFKRGNYLYKIQNLIEELYIGEKEFYTPVVRINLSNKDVNMSWVLDTNGKFKEHQKYHDFKEYVDNNPQCRA